MRRLTDKNTAEATLTRDDVRLHVALTDYIITLILDELYHRNEIQILVYTVVARFPKKL